MISLFFEITLRSQPVNRSWSILLPRKQGLSISLWTLHSCGSTHEVWPERLWASTTSIQFNRSTTSPCSVGGWIYHNRMQSARVLFISAEDAIVLFYSFFHLVLFLVPVVRDLSLFIEISLGSQPTNLSQPAQTWPLFSLTVHVVTPKTYGTSI